MRKKWLDNIYSHQALFSESSRICDLHFIPTHLGKIRLSTKAVPIIFNSNGRMTQSNANDASSETEDIGTAAKQMVDDGKNP